VEKTLKNMNATKEYLVMFNLSQKFSKIIIKSKISKLISFQLSMKEYLKKMDA
jgi:hypothetical protein